MMELDKLKVLLSSPQKISITMHDRPDGDAIGSSLALYHYLIQGGHEVSVIAPTAYPIFLQFLPANNLVTLHSDANLEVTTTILNNSTIIFILDFSALRRNAFGTQIGEAKAKKVMIDHHLDPEDFADFSLWDTKASSTGELIYRLIDMLGDKHLLNQDIATCLYTAICSDTGRFKYNTNPNVLRITADLLEQNIDLDVINSFLFDNYSFNRLLLMGYAISERLIWIEEYNTAIIYLAISDFRRFNCESGDTEGLVNFALNILGVKFAALVKEAPDMIKISFRSKGDFSVKDLANKHFNGGGHKNASGGSSRLGLHPTLDKIKSLLPKYADELQQPYITALVKEKK